MTQRIQKILSERGVCSRRKAEAYIMEGRVTVNGNPANLGDTADPDVDMILLDGNPLPSTQKPVYIMLYKKIYPVRPSVYSWNIARIIGPKDISTRN